MIINCSLDGKEIDVTDVTFNYVLNDIGTLQIGLKDKPTDYYMKPIKLYINDNLWWQGKVVDVSSTLSVDQYSLGLFAVHDYILLTQTDAIFYNYANASNKKSNSATDTNAGIESRIDNALKSFPKNLWEMITEIILGQLDIFNKTSPDSTSLITTFQSNSFLAFKSLLTANSGLLNKVKKLISEIDAKELILQNDISYEQVKSVLRSLMSNESSTLWTILLSLAEMFCFNIGYNKSKYYIFPSAPYITSQTKLDNMISMRVDSLNPNVKTRALISYDRNTMISGVTGSFPSKNQNPSEPTSLEKYIGAVHLQVYSIPLIASPADKNKDNYDEYAEAYYKKELFKSRTATITKEITDQHYLGQVVEFTDPKYDITYNGQVYKVEHSINSCTTTLVLQYVIEKENRSIYGLTELYNKNPLFPNFNGLTL